MQLIYLLTLLSFLVVGAYLVVRQVLCSNVFPPQLFVIITRANNISPMVLGYVLP